jgi:hypothetical protein
MPIASHSLELFRRTSFGGYPTSSLPFAIGLVLVDASGESGRYATLSVHSG